MQPDEKNDIFDIVQRRLADIEARQNWLIQKLGELHNHVSRLYGMGRNADDLPDATGHLALQQRAALRLAEMVAADLRANGIGYFLSAGNLLGAARNGKFVPWDDDIDFGLMRPDFNRAVELLSARYNHGHFQTVWAHAGGIFKVLFMGKICLDLFPWDCYYKHICTPKELERFKMDYRAAMNAARDLEQGVGTYATYYDIVSDLILHGRQPDWSHGDLFEAIDWQLLNERIMGQFHDGVWNHEYILPYGEIEFCGKKFSAPNNPDAWLTTRYGDWSVLSPEFSKHVSGSFTYAELGIVRAFIDGQIK